MEFNIDILKKIGFLVVNKKINLRFFCIIVGYSVRYLSS